MAIATQFRLRVCVSRTLMIIACAVPVAALSQTLNTQHLQGKRDLPGEREAPYTRTDPMSAGPQEPSPLPTFYKRDQGDERTRPFEPIDYDAVASDPPSRTPVYSKRTEEEKQVTEWESASHALVFNDASLDATTHSGEIRFSQSLGSTLLALDATLPWRERFKDNEEFDEQYSLDLMPILTLPSQEMAMMDKKKPSDSNGMMSSQFDALGTVKSVKSDQGKIKIAHGPIDKFGMPAMTMMFKVTDTQMLNSIKAGDEIGFNVEQTSAGFFVSSLGSAGASETMLHTMPMKTEKPDDMSTASVANTGTQTDALGMVKVVRANQAKVKIEHGPIDRLGMPAMTMMFKVKDPAMLQNLEPGTEIGFDVDTTSGGFVITRIQRR